MPPPPPVLALAQTTNPCFSTMLTQKSNKRSQTSIITMYLFKYSETAVYNHNLTLVYSCGSVNEADVMSCLSAPLPSLPPSISCSLQCTKVITVESHLSDLLQLLNFVHHALDSHTSHDFMLQSDRRCPVNPSCPKSMV